MMMRAHFRYIVAPCCGTQLCWVNPRLPNYCPECGKYIFDRVASCVTESDVNAMIHMTDIVPSVEMVNEKWRS
jgi:hypothetical protein